MNWDYILNQPAFVIHSSKLAPERKDFFTETITNAGYKNMQIFESVNGYIEEELNDAINMFGIKFTSHLGLGQKGCLLSHLKLYLHIIKNNIDICTIFEDDVYFHSDYNNLAQRFYENTPKNFDILFIGNQLNGDINTIPRINRKTCYCTHGYIISLRGAKKLLQLILKWNYCEMGNDGITAIDIIIENIQQRVLLGHLNKRTLIWYCWNGIKNECKNRNNLKYGIGWEIRNTGLVYQSSNIPRCIK